MQPLPYSAGPMSAGGAPVPGIPSVAGLGYPPGVNPSLTQYPTAPPAGYPPAGFPAPQVSRTPGPAMLGPGPGVGTAAGTGGVPGVSMGAVGGVAPPAATGGPHPLPMLPQIPLPQGFPNPFEVQGLGPQGPVAAPQGGMPPGMPGGMPGGMPPGAMPPGMPPGIPGGPPVPGVQTLTGPQGYLPGLGYFGMPGSGQGQPGLPGPAPGQLPAYGAPPQVPPMPGRLPMPPGGPQGAPFPFPFPGAQQQAAAPQPAPHAAPAQSHPFWMQLAWQLVQTPAVRGALGQQLDVLLRDDRRPRTLAVAAATLAGPELQAAFRAMTGGAFEQTRFTELFADRLKGALQAAGV